MSSALTNNFAYLQNLTISLICNAYKRGFKHDPCGTKLETGNSLECEELTQTSKILFRKLWIQLKIVPTTPYLDSLSKSLSCGIVSKAFDKSIAATSILLRRSYY